jgi:mRNA degradation ribonuclease J1/J2
MQIARMHSPVQTLGRMRCRMAGGAVGRDHAGLHARFAQHRHGGDVADLGDLLEDEGGVEYRQAQSAIFLGHGHAEHAGPASLRMFSQGNVPSMYLSASPRNSDCARSRTVPIIWRCSGVRRKSIGVSELDPELAGARPSAPESASNPTSGPGAKHLTRREDLKSLGTLSRPFREHHRLRQ